MRKFIMAVAAVAALSTPALAEPDARTGAVELGTGAVTGTVVGVGLNQGWFASGTTVAAAAGTTAGAVAIGGVAGVGTVALLDSAIEPCQGFQALFGMNKGACVDGHYVGYAPAPRRVVR